MLNPMLYECSIVRQRVRQMCAKLGENFSQNSRAASPTASKPLDCKIFGRIMVPAGSIPHRIETATPRFALLWKKSSRQAIFLQLCHTCTRYHRLQRHFKQHFLLIRGLTSTKTSVDDRPTRVFVAEPRFFGLEALIFPDRRETRREPMTQKSRRAMSPASSCNVISDSASDRVRP